MPILKKWLSQNRSYRRFQQKNRIALDDLQDWVGNTALCPSAANLQPLRYVLCNRPAMNQEIFKHLKWAAYLKEWEGPVEGEKPAAYIVMAGNRKISPYIDIDAGIAMQTILLSATAKGFGGCAIASCNKPELKKLLGLGEELEVILVLALGRPKEKVVLETIKDNDVRYWRDDNQVHHVPKRPLAELIVKVFD